MPRRNVLGPKPRLSRRRLSLLIVLALVAILLVAEVINDAEKQSPAVGRRLSSSWVSGVEPMLASSSAVVSIVASIERDPSAQTIATTNTSLVAADLILSGAQSSMRALGLPTPSLVTARLAAKVLAERVATIDSLRRLLVATGLHESGPAVGACLSLQHTVGVGDAALVDLRSALRSSRLGDSRIFKPWALVLPRLKGPGCTALVDKLASNPALVARFALRLAAVSVDPGAVQINGVPNPTSTTTTVRSKTATTTSTTTTLSIAPNSGTTTTSTTTSTSTTLAPQTTTTLQIPPAASRSVLPPTTTITVQVVVANSGNESLDGVQVSVQLLSSSVLRAPLARNVGAMLPGSARDLTFGPIPLGRITGSFRLQVSATASNLVRTSSTITLVRSPH